MRIAAALVLAALAAGCGPGDGAPPVPPASPSAEVSVPEHLRRAQDLLSAERLAEAAAEYREVLRRDAKSIAALEGLSRIAGRMNDPAAQLGFISRAAELKPDDGSIVNQLGVALVANGRKREAAETFERAMALRPKDPMALLNAAQNQADLADWARARRYAASAAELSPEDAMPWLLLGRFEMRQGKFADAIAPLREAAKRAPAEAMVQYYLGKALVSAGRRAEAEEPLRAALKGNPPPEIRKDLEALLSAK